LFVHGTNHHSLTCDIWPGVCDDDHDNEEERRTLRDAQFDAVTAAGKRPPRKLSKKDPPLPPRPVFCDEFTMYWNTTAYKENILVQGSEPAQRGTKTCLNVGNATDPLIACRGDNAQVYGNLYTDPALTQYGGRYADNELVVQTAPNFVTLVTGSIEVQTPDFAGEILLSNVFGKRFEITAGSKSYLGATGTVETNTEPFKGEVVGEFIIRCELTNPSNP
jgi:hypothetical protein